MTSSVVFQRFRDVPKVDMALAEPEPVELDSSPRHEAATMVLTLAAYAVHAFFAAPAQIDVPEIVRPVPVIDAAADCRAQNEDYPVLWMQCEEL